MKILIYGSKGWIGNQFIEILKNNQTEYYEGKSRVDNLQEVEDEIKAVKPTHVISLIGRTHGKIEDKVYSTIDYLEQPNKLTENIRDNLFSPLMLASICKKENIHFTYLGTGCIFTYNDEHPFGKEENGFTESSLPNFFGSSYSVVKGYTDRMINQINENALNLRIRMPITAEKNTRNFITKISTYKKICSVSNSMTVLPELLPCVVDMMKNNEKGTINLTNPGLISHNEILQMYKEIVDSSFTWENFSYEEQIKILSSERSNNYLDTSFLESKYNVKNIKDSVRRILENYK
jgi:dTDP-4-dehydrorhamnose reductase